jgi:hypothetical protein
MMSHNTKKTANSLLPLGAAVAALITIGLVTWFSQDLHLVKPEVLDPLKAEQERISSMLSKINNDIAQAQQLRIKKQTSKTVNK